MTYLFILTENARPHSILLPQFNEKIKKTSFVRHSVCIKNTGFSVAIDTKDSAL